MGGGECALLSRILVLDILLDHLTVGSLTEQIKYLLDFYMQSVLHPNIYLV